MKIIGDDPKDYAIFGLICMIACICVVAGVFMIIEAIKLIWF
jgi:hypothetical protein